MRKNKTLHVNEKCHSQIKYISQCLGQNMNVFLEELTNQIFQIFSSFNPKNRDATLFYDNIGTKLILNSHAVKNYLTSGCIAGVNPNISEFEENQLVKERLEGE